MPQKKDKKDELDTETTIADMNLEGFKWYDPSKKGDKKTVPPPKVTRKEYWQMVKGAFAAFAPFFFVLLLSFAAVVALAYFWLSH
jgi:hypothetical protein